MDELDDLDPDELAAAALDAGLIPEEPGHEDDETVTRVNIASTDPAAEETVTEVNMIPDPGEETTTVVDVKR